jgi:hypothetical protein
MIKNGLEKIRGIGPYVAGCRSLVIQSKSDAIFSQFNRTSHPFDVLRSKVSSNYKKVQLPLADSKRQ